jgi:hypothetical protein
MTNDESLFSDEEKVILDEHAAKFVPLWDEAIIDEHAKEFVPIWES